MAKAKGNKAALRKPTRKKSSQSARNAIWNHALIAIVTGVVGVAAMVGLIWWQLVVAQTLPAWTWKLPKSSTMSKRG